MHFQSNTVRNKEGESLSHVFLGKQVLQYWPDKLKIDFNDILILIQQQYREIINEI